MGSLAIKGEYISQEKRHFLENVELDVYADDQKIIDHQDFHLKVEDFHYDKNEIDLDLNSLEKKVFLSNKTINNKFSELFLKERRF